MNANNNRKTAKIVVKRDWLVREFATFEDARVFLDEIASENEGLIAAGHNAWIVQRVRRDEKTCEIIVSARYPRVMLVHNWRC